MNKRIKQTLKMAKKKFQSFGFSEEQLSKLLDSGERDLVLELKKLKKLIENNSPNLLEINKSIHGLKGLLLNMGNQKVGDKLTEFREKSSLDMEDLKEIYEYLKLDQEV